MKTLIWKIRYTIEICRLLHLSPVTGWQMAGSTVEDYGDDIDIYSPREAAENERDEWLACT
jgi:hypothetical protein